MKETCVLTKILFKNSLNKNSNKNKLSMTILIMFIIAYIVGVMGYLSYQLINSLKLVNQEQIFLSLCLLMAAGVTLFKTILTALNVLYFSKDVEFLLPLPLKPINIVLAKFNVMLISEYITEIITFVVPFAVYGYLTQASLAFYIYSILVFLFLPIIPMLISILIIVVIMRFTKFLNNKDIVQYLSVGLTIVIVIAMQFMTTSSNEVTDFMVANKMIEINGLADVVSEYFFTVKQATIAITKVESVEAIKNLLWLGVESIVAYILVAFAVSKVYIKTAIYSTVSGQKTKKKKGNNFVQKSVGLTYIKKEMKILFRNPVFFLQCVLPSILFPIIFSIPLYRTMTEAGTEELSALKNALTEVFDNSMGIGIVLAIINFLYMFNFISVTSISRDGENAIFMKYIPVKLHTQCKYKAIPSIVLNMVPIIYVTSVIKYLVPEIMLVTLAEIFVLAMLCNILISYMTVLIDIIRPKLHWTSEYSVVKQNMNMLYDAIFVLFVIGTIILVCAYVDNLHVMTGILLAIAILVLVIYEIFLRKYSRQIFKKVS